MIYFIQDSAIGLIKIGHTNGDPMDRLRALQTGSASELVLLATMDGDESHEKRLHADFAELRERGEWFRPMPRLIGFLISRVHRPPPASLIDYWYGAGFDDGGHNERESQKAYAQAAQMDAQYRASLG